MRDLKKIIKYSIREFLTEQEILNENIQLADKIYFKPGKLSEEDKEVILRITNGNNYTKLISDFYFYYKNLPYRQNKSIDFYLRILYNDVLNYNKNVFPIKGYDINNPGDISELIGALENRRKIINELQKLPSIATRNLKHEIREKRSKVQLANYLHGLEDFTGYYSLLSNRDENARLKIIRKMFKSNVTLDKLINFAQEKENMIGGVEFTKDDVKKLSKIEDFEIIYEQGDVMIVQVDSPEGIKAIGCNSLWCFTYGTGFESAYRQWGDYSYNDIVYVLIDFREDSDSAKFMHVLIKPLTDEDGDLIDYDDEEEYYDSPIFDMGNENYRNPYDILKYLFGENYKSIIQDYLNFDY